MSNLQQGDGPIVSVVMPLYNKRTSITRAIDSVLAQTLIDFEIIIVNDGSSDDSLDVAKNVDDCRIRYIDQRNQGPGAARNNGASVARAPLLAFLDCDDEWRPTFLSKAVEALESHPGCGAYVCGYDSGHFRKERPNKIAMLKTEAGPYSMDGSLSGHDIKSYVDSMHSSCTVVRKNIFNRFSGFYSSERCRYGEDSYLWLQILLHYSIYCDPAEHVLFHVEDSSLGFAQLRRTSARPISLNPGRLRERCGSDSIQLLDRAIACFVAMDLTHLRESNSFFAAYQLRRLHGLPRITGLIEDVSFKVIRKMKCISTRLRK